MHEPGTDARVSLSPSSPREVLPLEGHTIHSTNWSGYAVTSKRRRITAVTGSFVVPRVTGTHPLASLPRGWASGVTTLTT